MILGWLNKTQIVLFVLYDFFCITQKVCVYLIYTVFLGFWYQGAFECDQNLRNIACVGEEATDLHRIYYAVFLYWTNLNMIFIKCARRGNLFTSQGVLPLPDPNSWSNSSKPDIRITLIICISSSRIDLPN